MSPAVRECLRDVAGQDLGAGEDQDRNGQQKDDAQRNALGTSFTMGEGMSARPGSGF